MVDREVIIEAKKVLESLFPGYDREMIDYLFKCRVLDVNKCRIAVIKRYYRDLIKGGLSAAEAKYKTAERFFRSEKTIENIIYNPFYRDIVI